MIRPRAPADDADITRINDIAFGTAGEARLIQALRNTGDDRAGRAERRTLIGHILFSRSCSAIHDPRYYQRFGFSTVLARHLQAPYSGDAFMALALRPGALGGQSGRVVYPAAFALVD